jgi:hypothetical protein
MAQQILVCSEGVILDPHFVDQGVLELNVGQELAMVTHGQSDRHFRGARCFPDTGNGRRGIADLSEICFGSEKRKPDAAVVVVFLSFLGSRVGYISAPGGKETPERFVLDDI